MTTGEHPRRHHLADGPLSSLYATSLPLSSLHAPSPSLSSFGAASVMMCCSARPASSRAPSALPKPMASSHHFDPFAKFKLVWRRICICRFCNHLNVLHIFDQTCIVLMLGWRSTAGLPDSPPHLSPSHPPTPWSSRRPAFPPLPSLSSFGAACVKLCGLPRPSLDIPTVAAVSSSLQRRKYKVRFEANMNIKPSIILFGHSGCVHSEVAV